MPRNQDRQTFGRLRRFVRGDGVRMFFQPITDLDTGSVIGFESLARFDSPSERTTVSWFDEASAAGMRRDLELTTARAALRALADLPEDAYLTVNASPDVAMDPDFLSAIPETHRSRLVVEITEHARIDDYDAFNRAIARLRALGVRVAIDDAGAGFANLTHILRIHPDLIKLDVELTRHVDIDADRRALVRSLVEFARSVGATLVAEGIETEGELLALRSLGVAAGQGYHIGRPAPLPGETDPIEPASSGLAPSLALALDDLREYLRIRRMVRRSSARRGAFRPAAIAIITSLVLMPTGFAVAADAAPGSPAYWVKRKFEAVRLLVALDRGTETRLHLEFAQRRMDELADLLSNGRSDLARMVLDDYRAQVEAVDGAIESEPATPGLRKRISRDLSDHVALLDEEREALCKRNMNRGACRSAAVAIHRSKRTLSHSERPPLIKNVDPEQPAPATEPPGGAKPKNPNAKGALQGRL